MSKEWLGMLAGGLAGNIIDSFQTGENANTQLHNYKEFANFNAEKQREMTDYNQRSAYDMWLKTGIKGQVEQLQNNGLNVGLMMSNGTGGGSATVSQGNVKGEMVDVNKGGTFAGAQLGMQQALTKAQVELAEANANKANVEAKKIAGADTDNTIADTSVKNTQAKANEIANYINTELTTNTIEKAKVEYNKAVADFRSADANADVDSATVQTKINKLNAELTGSILENELTDAKIDLTNEQKRAISVELAQEWENLYLRAEELDIRKQSNAIQEFAEKWKARLGIGNLEMRKIEAGLNVATQIIKSGKRTTKTETTKYDKDGNYGGETHTTTTK